MTAPTTQTSPSDVLTADTPRGTLTSPTGTDGESLIRQPSVITTQAGSLTTARPESFFVTSTIPIPQPIGDTPMPTGTERLSPTGSPRNESAEAAAPTHAVDVALIRSVCAWLAGKGYGRVVVRGHRITARQ